MDLDSVYYLFGKCHKWLKEKTTVDMYGRRYTTFSCQNCSECFSHYYNEVPSFYQAAYNAGVKLHCTTCEICSVCRSGMCGFRDQHGCRCAFVQWNFACGAEAWHTPFFTGFVYLDPSVSRADDLPRVDYIKAQDNECVACKESSSRPLCGDMQPLSNDE